MEAVSHNRWSQNETELRKHGYKGPLRASTATGELLIPGAPGMEVRVYLHESCGSLVFDPAIHQRFCPAPRPRVSTADWEELMGE